MFSLALVWLFVDKGTLLKHLSMDCDEILWGSLVVIWIFLEE